MIVFKKYRTFALFGLLIVSFAGLLQGSDESTLSRSWASVSNFGDKILKHPATPYLAAPAALYAGYQLARIPADNDFYPSENLLIDLPVGLALAAAYQAPSLALTELMRKQRETVHRLKRPSKLRYFGPALVQSLIMSGFLLSNDFMQKILGPLPILAISLLFNPGLTPALCSINIEGHSEQLERQREHEERKKSERELNELAEKQNQQISQFYNNIERRWEHALQIRDERERNKKKSKEPQPDTCTICLEGHSKENELQETICHHKFHNECLLTWIQRHNKNTCPTCCADIVR